MNNRVKIVLVAAARPNFMKVAPIAAELRRRAASTHPELEMRLVHTGQHYDALMSATFFDELQLPPPDVNLEVGSGSHAEQTAAVMTSFEKFCLAEAPQWVVVVGDVNSTLACALVCSKLGIKLAHVEAGLRSFDRRMPEEINRIVTDTLADLLLTPSQDGDENLLREGVAKSKIVRVGNVMIDTLVSHLAQARRSEIPQQLDIEPRRFVFATLHRPSNVDERASLAQIMEELGHLAQRLPVVFSIHPRTRKMLAQFGIDMQANGCLHLIGPVGYHDSLWLTEHAKLIITDSGGLQEESTYLGTPCLTLRPNTERPVTVTEGTNQLVATPEELPALVMASVRSIGTRAPDGWDGMAGGRVIAALIARTSN